MLPCLKFSLDCFGNVFFIISSTPRPVLIQLQVIQLARYSFDLYLLFERIEEGKPVSVCYCFACSCAIIETICIGVIRVIISL